MVDVKQELRNLSNENCVTTMAAQEAKAFDLNEIIDFTRHGSLRKIITVVAYILRFKNNLLAKKNKNKSIIKEGILTADEASQALDLIIRTEQQTMAGDGDQCFCKK